MKRGGETRSGHVPPLTIRIAPFWRAVWYGTPKHAVRLILEVGAKDIPKGGCGAEPICEDSPDALELLLALELAAIRPLAGRRHCSPP